MAGSYPILNEVYILSLTELYLVTDICQDFLNTFSVDMYFKALVQKMYMQ